MDEFTVVLASGNGDLGEVKWTVILYWVLMGVLAIASIHAQLTDRTLHLEAEKYKNYSNAEYNSYQQRSKSLRERVGKASN